MEQKIILSHAKGFLFKQIVFAVSLAVLLLSALAVYLTYSSFNALGGNMAATLEQGHDGIVSILDRNQSELSSSVSSAERNTRAHLSAFLEQRLNAEARITQETLHESLNDGARALSVLLARISRDAIVARDFAQLVSYAKMASTQASIVYAVFFKPDGQPYTRYVNRKDPQVKALIAKGSGRTGLDKLLSAADADESVRRIEQEILFDGEPLGRIVLGVSMQKADQVMAGMAQRGAQLIANSSAKVSEVLETEGATLARNLRRNFTQIREQNQQSGAGALQAINRSADSLLFGQIIYSSVAGLVIIGLLCWFFLARVIAPIRYLTGTMEDIASGDGDLTRRLPQNDKDEIGQLGCAFNHFVAKTQDTLCSAGDSIARLAVAADQLAAVAGANNESMTAQRSETEQAAGAISQMVAAVNQVAQNAEHAAKAAREANNEADSGREVVAETVAIIDTLAREVEQASEVINRLESDSAAIGSVLDVIRNIADQTNLLALNAAIEAARAGEQGRGFAVVAEEVRSLASRTQESTQEIQAMIERLQSGTREAVQVMSAGVVTTQNTVERAAGAGQSLENIVATVGTITEMNTQIAGTSEQQTVVAGEIDRSVTHISELSGGIAQGTEQLAGASRELAELGEELKQLFGRFKVA